MLPEKLELQRERIQRELDAAYELPVGTVIAGWPKTYLPDYPGTVNLDIQIVLRRQGFPIREIKAMRFVGADTAFEVYQGMPIEAYLLYPKIYDVWMWVYAGEVGSVAGPEAMPTTKPGYEIVLTGQRKTIGQSSWCLYEMTDIYPADYAKPGKMLASVSEKYEALRKAVSLCRKNKEFRRDESGGEYRNTRDIWRTGKYSPDDCDGFFAVIYRDVIEAGIKPEEVCVCSDVRRIGESKGHAMAAVAIPGDYLIGDGTGAYFQQEVVLLSEVIDRFQPFVIASHEGGGCPELRVIEPEPVITVVPAVIDPYSTTPPVIPEQFRVGDLILAASSRLYRWDNNPAYPFVYKGADNMRRMKYDTASCFMLAFWRLKKMFPDRPPIVAGDAVWDRTGICKHDFHNSASANILDVDHPLLVDGYASYYPMTQIWSGGNLTGEGNLLTNVIDLERIYWLYRSLGDLMSKQISVDDRILAAVQQWARNKRLPQLEYVTGDSRDGAQSKTYFHWLHGHMVDEGVKRESIVVWKL